MFRLQRTSLFVLLIPLLLISPLVAQAQSPVATGSPLSVPASPTSPVSEGALQGAEIFESEVALTSQEGGPNFRVGENVVITQEVMGDLYVAGGMVRIEAPVNGDLLVAGGQVTINSPVAQDIRSVGGTVTIRSQVGGSVTAVGGNLVFAPGSLVNGSVVVAGGNLSFEGTVINDVVAAAGNVELLGEIGRDARFGAGTLSLLPGSVVVGNLYATLDEESKFVEAGEVRGETAVSRKPFQSQGRAASQQVRDFTAGAVVGQTFMGWLMGVVGGSILLLLFPRLVNGASAILAERTGASLGWGFVALVVTPLLVLLAMITLLGIPVGFLLLLAYIMALIGAVWVSGIVLGQWVYNRTKVELFRSKFLQLSLGLLLIQVVGLIPVLGWLAKFAAFTMGLGALVLWLGSARGLESRAPERKERLASDSVFNQDQGSKSEKQNVKSRTKNSRKRR